MNIGIGERQGKQIKYKMQLNNYFVDLALTLYIKTRSQKMSCL